MTHGSLKARWTFLGFLLGFLCASVMVSAADRCVRLSVRPRVMIVNQDVDVQVRVWRHTDHRRLGIAWTVDGLPGGSSTRDLNGETAAFLHTLWLRDQPPGDYEFVVVVKDTFDRIVGSDRLSILGPTSTACGHAAETGEGRRCSRE